MHPLHEHVAGQVAEALKARRVLVWYDPRGELRPFVEELRAGASAKAGELPLVSVGGRSAVLAEYAGSFYEVRAAIEARVGTDAPEPTLVYVPGVERAPIASPLMELEAAGECWTPQTRSLRRFARAVLRRRFTDAVIDDMLAPESVTYADLARAAAEKGGEAPSLLKGIFPEARGDEALLAAWLASDERDAQIQAKEAKGELVKLARACVGLEFGESASLAKMRTIGARYVLANEFRADLECAAPASLASVPEPGSKDQLRAVGEIALLMRAGHAQAYEAIADRVQAELELKAAGLPGAALGRIDTFRFEEETLLTHAAGLIAAGKAEAALEVVGAREKSFWLDRDVARKAQWEACRGMAELARVAARVAAEVTKAPADPREWVHSYVGTWCRLDQVQRRLEALAGTLEPEPDEKALGVVRRAYEDAVDAMTRGFTRALEKAQWSVAGVPPQTRTFADWIEGRAQPVAYFLVDA
ncbi:MAG TPA: PglZ domain-containing protein, partial [Planctomycetota bacterium]|nr:PglZ domain-containing protein [Planctomycetota bacterium]